MKIINHISSASLKGATVALNQHVDAADALAAHAEPGAIQLSGNEALIASLLPGIADVIPQDGESSTAVSGRGGDSTEQYTQIGTGSGTDTDSDDDGSGYSYGKDMIADDGGGKSYDNDSGEPGHDGYESYPNGDGTYTNVYPDGSTQTVDENGNAIDPDTGTSEDDSQPEEDSDNGQSTGEPANGGDDGTKDDDKKDDGAKDDGNKGDSGAGNGGDGGDDDNAGNDDGTDNTPPPGCTPGTVVACGGDEEQHRIIPRELDISKLQGLKDGGNTDPADGDGTATVVGIAPDDEAGSLKDKLLGGCDLGGDGVSAGRGGATTGDIGNQAPHAGATDWGPDHTDSQGTGPEERNTQHEVKTEGNTTHQDDATDEDADGGDAGLVAIQPATSALHDWLAQSGGLKQDSAVDPHKLGDVHVKEALPGGPSLATGDLAGFFATQKPFEFAKAAPLDPVKTMLHTANVDPGGDDASVDLEIEAFTVPEIGMDMHHAPVQPVFELDFA